MIVPMVIMMWRRETVTMVNDLQQPHSPSWQTNSRTDNQDIFRLLGNKDTHYNVRTSPPVFPTLNQCHIIALQDYAPVDIPNESLCGSPPPPPPHMSSISRPYLPASFHHSNDNYWLHEEWSPCGSASRNTVFENNASWHCRLYYCIE